MNDNRNHVILMTVSWLFVLIWMIVIFMFSAQDSTESLALSNDVSDTVYVIVDETFPNADVTQESVAITTRNIAHFVLYFVLGALVLNALNVHGLKWPKGAIYAVLFSVLYSLTDEWHQTFVPGRGFEIKDLIIDFSGTVIGIGLLSLLVLLRDKRRQNQINI